MKSKFIDYKFYNKIRNFGDAINPNIIEWVSGARPNFTNSNAKHLLGIGSITFYANEHSHIWGSGVIGKDVKKPAVKTDRIFALRGELTKQFYESCGHNIPNIALGDPGFLISDVYPHLKKVGKKYKICYIPHHSSMEDPIFKLALMDDECCIFNILTDDVSELRKIAASEIVISQSLHGLIFAESLGVPSCWVSKKFDDNWTFKFKDWYSTSAEPWSSPLRMDLSTKEYVEAARLSHSVIDKKRLIKSFPRELIYNSSRNSLDYEECKSLGVPFVESDCLTVLEKKGSAPSDSDLKNSFSKCKEKLTDFYKGLDYPVYSIISPRNEVSPSFLKKATAFLDKKYSVSFAYLKPWGSMKSGVKVYSSEGLHFSKDCDIGASIIARPNGDINHEKNFITFYY